MHSSKIPSLTGGEILCLDISSNPNLEIRERLTLALSVLHAGHTFSSPVLWPGHDGHGDQMSDAHIEDERKDGDEDVQRGVSMVPFVPRPE